MEFGIRLARKKLEMSGVCLEEFAVVESGHNNSLIILHMVST
jgi:hypothetical protein